MHVMTTEEAYALKGDAARRYQSARLEMETAASAEHIAAARAEMLAAVKDIGDANDVLIAGAKVRREDEAEEEN